MELSDARKPAGRSAAGRLLRATILALAVLAAGPASAAMAEEPTVAIGSPLDGAVTNNSTPSFSGTTNDTTDEVTLAIYAGPIASGTPVQTLTASPLGESWSLGPSEHLEDGIYTVQATQTNSLLEEGTSAPVTFTVDTTPPTVTLSAPPALIGTATPSFGGGDGIAAGDLASVKLNIYSGESPSGIPVQSVEVTFGGSTWTTGPVTALPDGTYTAQAEQSDEALNTSLSAPATFTIDTTAPDLTLTAPAEGSSIDSHSQLVEGAAGMAQGDLPTVTIELFSGSTIGAHPLETLAVQAVGGAWGATFGGLADGTYTVRAEQSDEAGNVGLSRPSMFTVAPPVPVTTTTTDSVTTTTTDSVTTTTTTTDSVTATTTDSFTTTTPGTVTTSTNSLTTTQSSTRAPETASIATQTTAAPPPPISLIQPFPIVRIAGADTARGARLKLLTVQAPAAARITVWCRGHGCPAKPESRIAAVGRAGVVMVEFKHFERTLLAGAVLEVRVSEPGEIGKYTRFQIRHGKLPERLDMCLNPAGVKPIACPS